MKVVILCGGKGTRIRDVSADLPKPMVRIGDTPILAHIMGIYSRYGFDDFVLCLGYRSWEIKDYFLNFSAGLEDIEVDLRNGQHPRLLGTHPLPQWRVLLAETGLESATGYRIRRVRQYVDGETFMLTYGDGLGDIDIDALLDHHRSTGGLVTVTAVRPPARFGQLHITEGDRVTEFAEKPQAEGGLINGGFFVCEPGVFDYLPDDSSCSFEAEPLAQLAKDGQLSAYRHEGFWMPMDSSREYELLNRIWREGEAPWIAQT